MSCAAAARRFLQTLAAKLPPAKASALRRGIIEEVLSGGEGVPVGVVPAALPLLAEEDWVLCSKAIAPVCQLASGSTSAAQEVLALEALEALVVACPAAEVEGLLLSLRQTFGALLQGNAPADLGVSAARGAARCWAATLGALLRRGGFAAQASSFLEALLSALEGGPQVAGSIPMAFQVMVPPSLDSSELPASKLPPLALQQLSRTALPSLLERAKASQGGAAARRAALESAVALLCALPVEVARSDCGEELRWCALAGLRLLKDEHGNEADGSTEGAIFAGQVLQLLVRAVEGRCAWVEDDLNSIVPPLTTTCVTHRVPLVRLGGLQVLRGLVLRSRGHLAPFSKQIEAATRRAVEDRRREVRLAGVACLNAWHCGMADS